MNWPACQFFPVDVRQITASHAGPSENAVSRRVQAMKKPAKRIPRWLTIDLLILVVGAIITAYLTCLVAGTSALVAHGALARALRGKRPDAKTAT